MKPIRINLLANAVNYHYRGVIRGVMDLARKNEEILLFFSPYNNTYEIHEILKDQWKEYDALIVQVRLQEQEDFYKTLPIPCINISERIKNSSLVRVTPHSTEIGHLAAREFLSRGFCNFLFAGNDDFNFSHHRGEAFKALAREFGGRVFPDISLFSFKNERYWENNYALLKKLPKPLAIFCMNDENMHGMIRFFSKYKDLRIPEEIALLGVDNDEFICEFSRIAISSIELDTAKQGNQAAKTAFAMAHGEQPEEREQKILPKGIIHRRSTDTFAVRDPIVREALGIIERNFCHGLKISELADQLYVSRQSLDLKFKAELHRTPADCIRARQLDKAKELLKNGNLSLQIITEKCGFANQSQLTAFMKRLEGVTPSAWRQNRL